MGEEEENATTDGAIKGLAVTSRWMPSIPAPTPAPPRNIVAVDGGGGAKKTSPMEDGGGSGDERICGGGGADGREAAAAVATAAGKARGVTNGWNES